jgi:CopG family nickel-responsive transcriptional regulator
MKDPLVRFGVAIEDSLLRELDGLVARRGCTRSELLRDLARSEVGRAKVARGVQAVCTLTLVYDHHVRDLSERLTELQHQLGEGVRASLHIHLTLDLCLEVVVMRGRSDQLQNLADRILAMRGVKHGGIQIVPDVADDHKSHPHPDDHSHSHDHGHDHDHGHGHADASTTKVRASPARASRASTSPRVRNVPRKARAKSGIAGPPPANPPRGGRAARG